MTDKTAGTPSQTTENTPHNTKAPHPDTFTRLPPNLAWCDVSDNHYLYTANQRTNTSQNNTWSTTLR
eukprot:11835259-Prorocentrum_lima.AAC.1